MTVDKVELRRLAEATGGITWVASHATSHQGQRSSRSIYHYPTEFHCREIVETPDSDPENNESIHDESSWAFIGAANPAAVLSLLDENDQLRNQLRLSGISAELSIHDQVGRAVTGQLSAEIERDQLRAEIAELKSQLSESRAHDRTAMGYLADLRQIAGGDDFPSLVRNVEAMRVNTDRYEWLSSHQGLDYPEYLVIREYIVDPAAQGCFSTDYYRSKTELDRAIDAAMSSAKEKGDD